MEHYDIWDIETNNVVGHYTSVEEALRFVRDLLDTYGDAYASDLQLGGRDSADRIIPALGGSDLIKRARAVTSMSEAMQDHRWAE